MAAVATVPKPLVEITYQGQDVTRDLAPLLLSASYTDQDGGASDEIELQLEDVAGRWLRAWRPNPGDRVKLALGYVGGRRMDKWVEGTVDEIEHAGSPSTVTIRALVSAITQALRSPKTEAYEGLSLRGIADKIARRHDLQIVAAPSSAAALQRPLQYVLQQDEGDLEFLTRLADEHGLIVSVKADKLVFQVPDANQPKGGPSILTLRPEDLSRWTLLEKMQKTMQAVEVRYHDPDGALHHGIVSTPDVPSADVLRVSQRVETQAQADAVAEAALVQANKDRFRFTAELAGEPRLLAGLTVTLAGWGSYDADYYIETARHRVTRAAGYVTSIEARYGRKITTTRGKR